jgi:hypothetical protein
MKENETNLENRLRSWQPRQPSPRLKRQLFPLASRNEIREVWLRCLAPAVACLFLAVTIIHQEPGLSASSRQAQFSSTGASSNLNYAAVFPKQHTTDQNEVSHASFEWTNLSDSSSSISPFSPGQ